MTEDRLKDMFNRLYRRLRAYAATVMNDWKEGEDIACEAFLRLWEYNGDANDGYIIVTVKNMCKDRLKHRHRAAKHHNAILTETDYEAQFEDRAAAAEVKARLLVMIARLPEKHRQVITMRYIHGFETKEIAAAIGITVDTVRVISAKSVAYLRGKKKFLIRAV